MKRIIYLLLILNLGLLSCVDDASVRVISSGFFRCFGFSGGFFRHIAIIY